jgi:hypothetical protein
MGVEWRDSADKHGVPREEARFAILHAEGSGEVDGRPGQETFVYVGRRHEQSLEYLEVIAAHLPPRTIVVFHVMVLTDKYRYLLYEGESS